MFKKVSIVFNNETDRVNNADTYFLPTGNSNGNDISVERKSLPINLTSAFN
ncbi:hypothetical protein SAMD00019534_126110 [Acytostelium subglobosum LB1]|uniref:hypothetical protein n=1 Tax=Acytostelium subglobosum LB1 TaxID=1410327 RepID=UPI000644D22C|nr:hypothetical protein SAMD00019534_126350 [Acytostelium subglobosum LB1]XP_012747611.1 hypothetical protein SAMD00019534_126110 [Acytostelium subglobosum LB1]GAM29435.1 hypothetical protein SAMD00019534_126110 [Acytostelium subglobosum LB1]GAM29459.1 hypothetical protein SAMD00019534_126350 [Acytostelium subglobosum LB1]|eukprot:XP_012747595.1 hypothetical protein SAMD00019534_126350 [Acytostelium subglobosum LB1]